jgi:hypothetical protein
VEWDFAKGAVEGFDFLGGGQDYVYEVVTKKDT